MKQDKNMTVEQALQEFQNLIQEADLEVGRLRTEEELQKMWQAINIIHKSIREKEMHKKEHYYYKSVAGSLTKVIKELENKLELLNQGGFNIKNMEE